MTVLQQWGCGRNASPACPRLLSMLARGVMPGGTLPADACPSPPCLQDGDGSPEEVASLIQELLEDKRELLEECFGIQVSWEHAVMLLLRQRCRANCRSPFIHYCAPGDGM